MNKRKSEVQNKSSNNETNEDEQEYEEYFFQEHQHLIESANRQFGGDWSHSISRLEIDCADAIEGIYNVGVSAVVRVELKTGTHHEGLGYGFCCGKTSKPLSISIARKEAVLKGLQFALQCFYDVPANPASLKGFGLDSRVPSMIVSKSGLDEVDSNTASHTTLNGDKKLRTSPGVKQNSVLWKNTRLPTDSAPQKIELMSPNNKTGKPLVYTTPGGDVEDEERKLERKRKQRQKQEEFRQRFKQNLPENPKSSERDKMDELIENLDAAGASFISTQELNEMIKTTTVQSNTGAPLRRIPLLSSPPKDGPGPRHNWRPGEMNRTLIKADKYQ